MKRYNQFEFFRFVGALSVLIFHTARNTDFYDKVPLLFQNGPLWVYFFFVLSGFMLSYSYSQKEIDIKRFYLTRLFKFYPLFIFSLFLLLKIRVKMIYEILLIQSWIFGKALNYNAAAWYLSVLAFLILIFPFLLKFQKKYPKVFLFFVIGVNFYTYYVYLTFMPYSDNALIHHAINYFPLMHVSSFALGMQLLNQIKKYKDRKYYSLFIVSYFLILILFNQYNSIIPYFSSLISLSFAPLITFLYLDKGIVSKVLSNRLFVYLGNLSFSIYLLHIPIYYMYKKYITEINTFYNFITFFALVFTVSNLTKYFIENKYYKFLYEKYIDTKKTGSS